MMKEKTLIELLIIVFNSIRNNTPVYGGFCELTLCKHSLKLEESEKSLLINFFKSQANTTNFVSSTEVRDFNKLNVSEYYSWVSAWLFCPQDWKSRRKWLKEYIKSHS